ncbi:MAG: TIGR02757 family protein [Bacteroidia bacterium]
MDPDALRDLLDAKYDQYNHPRFIEHDPISIPHLFTARADVEVAGFFAAIIAWGRRDLIIRSARDLMARMDMQPHDFVQHASEDDLDRLRGFVHRTFNETDARALVLALRGIYQQHESLEAIFVQDLDPGADAWTRICAARARLVAATDFPARSGKHLADPATGASAKRLNMYLRWMVRRDQRGVDFGLWTGIQPSQLVCPLDVHTGNVARALGLLDRRQNDRKAATLLTDALRRLHPEDPVRYDFSLFGLGVFEGMGKNAAGQP